MTLNIMFRVVGDDCFSWDNQLEGGLGILGEEPSSTRDRKREISHVMCVHVIHPSNILI